MAVCLFPCSTVQGVCESVRSVVREEVEAALQRHAHTVNPEAQAQVERARKQVSQSALLWQTDEAIFCLTHFALHDTPCVCVCHEHKLYTCTVIQIETLALPCFVWEICN